MRPALEAGAEDAAPDVAVEISGPNDRASTAPRDLPWAAEAPSFPVFKAPADEGGSWVRLLYEGMGLRLEFVLDPRGERVWASYGEGVTDADVAALLYGAVIGCILRQRGVTCVHAGVVEMGGRAFLLLGAKGAGKSTTALALVRAGATLVADDVAVVTEVGGELRARYGQPRVRLRPDPAAALCGPDDALGSVWGEGAHRPSKQFLELGNESAAPLDLRIAGAYLLGERVAGDAPPSLRRLPAPLAVAHLMAHRYVPYMLDHAGQARDFALLGRLAAAVPVQEVVRTEGLDGLDAIVRLIGDDARSRA